MATAHNLSEERASVWAKMTALNDKILGESRGYSAEEQAEWSAMESDLERLDDQITKQAKLAQIQKALSQPRNPTAARPQPTDSPVPAGSEGASVKRSLYEQLRHASSLGASRQEALQHAIDAANADTSEETAQKRSAARKFLESGAASLNLQDRAALQMDVDASGGTLVMPEEFIARIIMGLDESVFMRRIATVLPLISAESVGVPTLDTDPDDADWTTELAIGSEDTAMATGKRNLHPHPLAKLIKVSKTLMRRSAIPAESLIRDRLTFKFGVSEEKGFLTGNGANQPLGVFTASSQGIPTSRDVSDGNTSTDVTFDGLINAKYSLASQYLASNSLRWIFHRLVVRNIRKLKDGNGQYLWSVGQQGQPSTILEHPYEMSEFAPSTLTTGQYVGLIGDFKYYWIAESLKFELQRLDELYAATNQVGFIGRLELDAQPVLSEAFARVKLG